MASIRDVPRGQWTNHLVAQLRTTIRSGILRPGVRLPSTRSLASDLGVSRGVALAVYDQLKAEGYLRAIHGSGTVVADIPLANEPPIRASRQSRRLDSPGLPDPGLFPRKEWLRAYKTAFENLPDGDLRYGDPQGFSPLRHELADYLGRVRGIHSSPDQILIVNGFAQGLAVLARILPAIGIDTIAVEEPGSAGTRTQLRDWGLSTPPADVDRYGLSVQALRATNAPAVLVTPAHHYPTGVALSPERRLEILEWVSERPNRFIIEDDYDAEYRYDLAPVGSLQPLNPQRVITGSSVSKTLAPALRLGWLVLPATLIGAATDAKATFDLGVAVPCQAALAELLRTGAFDRHLRRSRQLYRQKRQLVAAQLRAALPDANLSGIDAGLNICVQLRDGIDDRALAAKLTDAGLRCKELSHYQQRSPGRRGLVIDISRTTEDVVAAIQAALGGNSGIAPLPSNIVV